MHSHGFMLTFVVFGPLFGWYTVCHILQNVSHSLHTTSRVITATFVCFRTAGARTASCTVDTSFAGLTIDVVRYLLYEHGRELRFVII